MTDVEGFQTGLDEGYRVGFERGTRQAQEWLDDPMVVLLHPAVRASFAEWLGEVGAVAVEVSEEGHVYAVAFVEDQLSVSDE